ncbi:MAG: IMP dehydrogenase [Calditrichia bacterium]
MTKVVYEGLTFDDVLLQPAHSQILPKDADLSTRLTNRIRLNSPLLSAAMDTVTESAMAIAIAREGGIGIIHKNMSLEAQATQIDLVKRSESGMIIDPITLTADRPIRAGVEVWEKHTIFPASDLSRENGWSVSSLIAICVSEQNIDQPIDNLMTKETGYCTCWHNARAS